MPTVAELLRVGIDRLREAGSDTPRLDAELLLGKAVGVDRTAILAHPEVPVGIDAAATYESDLSRRATGEPVAYIRGFKEFFGLVFATDPRALIPRPETELLVQLALDEIVRRLTNTPRPPGTPRLRVADVGTGAGTIAVSIATVLRRRKAGHDVELFATDVSEDALQLAKENAVGHAVADVMRFAVADVLPPVLSGPFDIVLANLPYIRSDQIAGLPVAASFEPRLALDGGPDGLTVIRALLERLPEALLPAGVGMFEIGADEAAAIRDVAAELLSGWQVRIENDLGGGPRVAVIQRAAD